MVSRVVRAFALSAVVMSSACQSNAPVDAADPDGTLTTVITRDPILDPQLSTSAEQVATISMVFEPLLRFDPKTSRPIPAAARALPEISADGLTYRLTLRDDIKYSDGSPVRARDFAFGLSRLCDPAIKAYYASVLSVVVGCADWSQLDPNKDAPEKLGTAKRRLQGEGIRATSDVELKIRLRQPASYFSSILALWFAVPERDADVGRGEDWTEPATYIGNGPFVLGSWRHNDRLVLTPNRYYRSPPQIKQWTKVVIAEEAVALNAYRHDEIDIFSSGQQGSALLAQIQGDAKIKDQLAFRTNPCTDWIALNSRRPPLDDPVVRLALAKAIDRQAWVRELLGGVGIPATSLIAPGLPGHDPADTIQRFDPVEARRLLASSRYAGSEALRSIVIPHNLQPFPRTRAGFVRDQWNANLGIEVRTEQLDGPGLAQLYRKPETVPLVDFGGWCTDYPDQQDWLSILFRSTVRDEGVAFYTGFSDPEFDRLVDRADVERDQTTRDDLYQRASRMLSERAVVIYVSNRQAFSLRKPWVRGIVESPLDIHIATMTGTWDKIFIGKRGR